MKTDVTIERKDESTQRWNTIWHFTVADDGQMHSIHGDLPFLQLTRFIDPKAGIVTFDSHPHLWIKHLAKEYTTLNHRLTAVNIPDDE